ncbi:MAG: hypothetical protein ACK5BK_01235 [Bacteroidota bacterium]
MEKNKIDVKELLHSMISASKDVLKKEWKQVAPVAELQIKNILHNIEQIAVLKITGKITEEQAKLHLTIQKESFKTILLSFEGIGIVTAEKAINAALHTVKTTINKAIGWRLL